MSDTLIKVQGVSKKFCRSLKKSLWYGMQDLGREITGRRHGGDGELRPEEFWAVRDVSFELNRGECLGLIGPNGAGKSTLLKMLNGLIKPDQGHIEMHGRIGALIELGAGFNPILTGRENIYVNGSVLGLTKKEIDQKLDEIIDFADIGEFIDAPVQSYSSGMKVRLGFAIAAQVEPDILIIDEVLAVGDVGFRTKCYNRIYDLAENTAIIFVSHTMSQVARLCRHSLLLQSGEKKFIGDSSRAIENYNRSFSFNCEKWQKAEGVTLECISINGFYQKNKVFNVNACEEFIVEFDAKFPHEVKFLELSLSFLDVSQNLIAQINNRYQYKKICNLGRKQKFTINSPMLPLGSGIFFVSLSVVDAENNFILFWAPTAWKICVSNKIFIAPPVIIDGKISTGEV
jgi:lipopolysaccharide transport system ATP-binding protein